MASFATPEQYKEFAEDDFDGDDAKLAKRLRSASYEVAALTRGAVYDVDADGLPTGVLADVFAEATCAIVEQWEATDDPFDVDAVQGAVKIGSVSLGTTSSSTDNLTPAEKLARRIGSRAVTILTNAGLIGTAVAHT
ncbi:hypothetical protein B0I12_002555 [Microbacterium hydrothermale]|uniref:hypothetical protein n=1 Tax=Microbacterium hydrothermale TaxID=857427 RepID=UPI00222641B5|nr:hypothetical protein [Microbacterium hydrothermale]MCW2165400.1 hypothetical protein [Microbacterium hydrothermale]